MYDIVLGGDGTVRFNLAQQTKGRQYNMAILEFRNEGCIFVDSKVSYVFGDVCIVCCNVSSTT